MSYALHQLESVVAHRMERSSVLDENKNTILNHLETALTAWGRGETPPVIPSSDDPTLNRLIDSYHLATETLRSQAPAAQGSALNHHGFLERVLASLPGLVSYMNRDLKYLYVNEAYEKWFGVKRETCLKSTMQEVVGEKGVQSVLPQLQAAFLGEPQEFEREVPYKYGGIKTIHVQYIPDKDPSGAVCGLIVIVQDVTKTREKERELKSIFWDSPLGIIRLDSSYRYLAVNPAYEKLLGYSAQELSTLSMLDLTHPDDRVKTLERAQNFPDEGDGVLKRFEKRYQHKSGRTVWVRVTSQVVRDGNGKNTFLSIIEDISVQKASEIETQTIFETMADGLLVQDQNGQIQKFNPSALSLLGLTADQLKNSKSTSTDWCAIKEDGSSFSKDENPATVASLKGQPVKGVIMGIKTGAASDRWIKLNAIPFDNASGRQVACTFSDVTDVIKTSAENARLAQRADESRTLLQSVADHFPGPISMVDRDGRYVFANKIYYDWFGKTPEAIVGRTHSEVLPPDIYANAAPAVKKALAGQRVSYEENHFVTVKGDILQAHIQMIPHLSIDGSTDGFFTVVHDVTELKKAEAQLIHSLKLASLGEMSAGIAHEINNPLAIISGSIGLLSKFYDDPEKLASKVDIIKKSCDRIARIVGGLKKYSRSGDQANKQYCELSKIIEDTLILTEMKSKRESTNVMVDCKSRSSVLCVEVEIEQILVNLVGNAIDAVKDQMEKWVKVALFDDAESVVLQVTDSGPGIPEHVRGKIFEPFFTTKAVGEGTGLGLSITKGILDDHHATITVLPHSPHTCFEIRFPKAREMTN